MHKGNHKPKTIKLDKAQERLYFGVYIRSKNNKKVRVTDARVNVLSALSEIYKPVSIKELALSVSVKEHDTSTLYRTLDTLVKIGLVHKIATNSGESLYETTIGRHHHHHITCTACGLLEDMDICAPLPSKAILNSKGFATMTNHSFELFGICKSCAKP